MQRRRDHKDAALARGPRAGTNLSPLTKHSIQILDRVIRIPLVSSTMDATSFLSGAVTGARRTIPGRLKVSWRSEAAPGRRVRAMRPSCERIQSDLPVAVLAMVAGGFSSTRVAVRRCARTRTATLLKALSQRTDRWRSGWQIGGVRARERAIGPSPASSLSLASHLLSI